ncbi:ABC transporter ATP-binding protein [Nakamurella silvestris]|nr:ABC transporter ATP-binding protein [Nakamurella silvestris]
MTSALVRVEDLSVSFPGNRSTGRRAGGHETVAAVSGVDLTIGRGEFVSLIGPSGCGKSTVLRVIAGLQVPTAGAVTFDGTGFLAGDVAGGQVPSGGLRPTALMPQSDCLLPWRRALPNALIGARVAGNLTPAVRAEAAELFVDFGLGGFERSWPRELSGGMRQRLALLRTVLTGRPILLLDEPFAALDPILRRQLNRWLAGIWAAQQRTTVLVTHDVEEAMLLSDRILVMSPRPGRIIAEFRPDREIPSIESGGSQTPDHGRDAVMRAEILDALG